MAEAAVSFVVRKLGDLIVQEAIQLQGVRAEVEWLERELRYMRCFLKDADAKRKGDERVKNWVGDIRDVAYEAEDIIDTFMLKVSRRRRNTAFIGSINRFVARHEVGAAIEEIKKRLAEISNRRLLYGIDSIDEIGVTSNHSRGQDVIPLLPELHDDTDLVGFDDEKKMIVNQLVDENIKNRAIISIVGMGGLGKTTLTKSIYNSSEIKRSFDMRAWVSISQEFNPIEIVRKILSSVTTISKVKLEEGIETLLVDLCETLKMGKYLIVLDDVWKIGVWDQLKIVFPDANNGSRVIMTTRFLDVARFADSTMPPHELRFLHEQESWELFLSKAFPRQNVATCCPVGLVDVAHQLVRRCEGLPLALVVLGGLMSTKDKIYSSWNKVAEGMRWQHLQGGEICLEILALSYNDLPYYLKSCFLYFGIFPEDHEISETILVRLWTAEGFLQVKEGKTMEETASACLNELVQRCMVQVTRRRYDGSPRQCRVHDILHDMCISEAKNDRFFEIYINNDAIVPTTPYKARQLILYDKENEFQTWNYSNVKLRALFSFYLNDNGDISSVSRDKWLSASIGGFKLLRVIDLYNAPILELPSGIKSLIHLRYLGLRNSNVELIPSWIDNLYNLQTIDARYADVTMMPNSLWGIDTLRHVCFNSFNTEAPPPKMMVVPKKLQTLNGVSAGAWIENALPKLTNLCKLWICGVSGSYADALSISLQKLGRLGSLCIRGEDAVPSDNIIRAFTNQPCLSKLKLHGPFINRKRLPSFCEFPKNVMKITLKHSGLKEDPMPTLEKLPYLRYLSLLVNSYRGKQMTCSAMGFPQLLVLLIYDCFELEEWKIEEEAMPTLRYLQLARCPHLKVIPQGLKNVGLYELALLSMPRELEIRIRENTGEDWYKIQHVPNITSSWRLDDVL